MPKLFIVADKDRYAQVVPAISSLYDKSPEPKKLKTFPGTVHGTELFATESGAEFRDLLTRFHGGIGDIGCQARGHADADGNGPAHKHTNADRNSAGEPDARPSAPQE